MFASLMKSLKRSIFLWRAVEKNDQDSSRKELGPIKTSSHSQLNSQTRKEKRNFSQNMFFLQPFFSFEYLTPKLVFELFSFPKEKRTRNLTIETDFFLWVWTFCEAKSLPLFFFLSQDLRSGVFSRMEGFAV